MLVRRWLSAKEIEDVGGHGLVPDDSVAHALHALAARVNAPPGGITMWADVPMASACAAEDVANAVVARAMGFRSVTSPLDVLHSLSRVCVVRATFERALSRDETPAMTYARAVRMVAAELVAAKANVVTSLIPRAESPLCPNPFAVTPTALIPISPGPQQQYANPIGADNAAFAATLESFAVGGVIRLNVATLDDVAAHFRGVMPGSDGAGIARAFFASGPWAAPPIPRDLAAIMPEAPEMEPASLYVRALHLEAGRLRWRRLAAATAVFEDGLAAAFDALPLSPATPLARLIVSGSGPQAQTRTRMMRGLSLTRPTGNVAAALRRHMPRSYDAAQLALYAFEPDGRGEWCACISLQQQPPETRASRAPPEARLDLYVTRASLPVEGVEEAIRVAKLKLLATVWRALGWEEGDGCGVDEAAWGRSSAQDGGGSQRLVSVTASATLSFRSSTPTAASVIAALSERPWRQYALNLEEAGDGVVAFQYTRVDGFEQLTPAQQAVRLNSAMPVHVLANALVERYRIDPSAAQKLVEEETRKREFITLQRPQTLVLLRVSPTSGAMSVVVRGANNADTLPRIIDIVRGANDAAVVASPSAAAFFDAPATASYYGGDGDGADDDDVPPELREALASSMGTYAAGGVAAAGVAATDPGAAADANEGEGDGAANVPGRYVIAELHRADGKLFDTGQKRARFSRICAKNMLRQPIRVSAAEHAKIQREQPGAADTAVAAGSSPAAQAANRYICPKVWCPKSRTALTLEQFERLGRRCPNEAVHEEPLIFDSPAYWRGRDRHPGFLDPKYHSEGLCMPCCFLKPGRRDSRCAANNVAPGVAPGTSNARYIYGETTALSEGRYGLLPGSLHALFNSGTRCLVANTSHLTTRTSCVLRKGVAPGQENMFDCLATVLGLGVPGREVPQLVRQNLDVPTFLALHGGRLAQHFVPASMEEASADPVQVASFASWMASRPREYVETYGLAGVAAYVRRRSVLRAQDGPAAVQAMREFALFVAMQAYLDALRVCRSHEWILDLVNMAPPWLNPRGVHLVVLSSRAFGEDPVLSFPVTSYAPALSPTHRVVMMAQYGAQYEAMCRVMGVRGGIQDEYTFDAERSHAVRSMLDALDRARASEEKMRGDGHAHRASSVVRALEAIGERADTQVLNYSLQCVGLVTAAGLFVPLPAPDAIVLLPGERMRRAAFVEEAIADIFKKISGSRLAASDAAATFQRLSAALGSPAFGVDRVVPGGLLLRMGKVVPLSSDDRLLARYTSDASVFVNKDVVDRRGAVIRELAGAAARVDVLQRAFLRAVQEDAPALKNMAAVCSSHCALPFDVRHAYVAGLVQRFVGGATSHVDASGVADRLLLGRPRYALQAAAHEAVLGFAGTDPAAAEAAAAEAAGPAAGACLTTTYWKGKGREAAASSPPLQLLPPALLALFGVNGPASTPPTRASSRMRRSSRYASFSSSRGVRMEVIPLPLSSRAVAIRLMHYLDGIVHANAPLPLPTMELLAGPADAPPTAALMALAAALGIPVARLNPWTAVAEVVGHGGAADADLALLVASGDAGSRPDDVLLTRRVSRGSPELFGALTSMSTLSSMGAVRVARAD